jgi:NADH-quinone oxidoreductase subunit I
VDDEWSIVFDGELLWLRAARSAVHQQKNGSMRDYCRNVYLAVKTILIGMRITLRYCFARTITVQYPDVAPTVQPRFRGFHYYEIEKCIACDLCAKACPVDCIYIEKTGPRKVDKETGLAMGGAIVRYAIDYSKCMFCGLCTDPCPTGCIHMGDSHDMSGYDRAGMVVEFTELAKQGLQTPMPIWMQKRRLPAWAEERKQQWLERARPKREEMLLAMTERKPAPKPAPAVAAPPAAAPAAESKPAE